MKRHAIAVFALAGLAYGQVAMATTHLNSVSADVLARMTGIPFMQCALVVKYRKEIGRFTSLDQLYDVPGLELRYANQLREDADIQP